MIHPTAIIDPKAELADDVEVGPYCVIGANVQIGSGCVLKSHVVIEGHSTIGEHNRFFPFAAIGQLTQDLKYKGEPTSLVIGNHNTFRENSTIHRSTVEETPTRIGDNNLFLCYTHVAHDCQIGNHCILSNNGTLAGHCVMEDHAIIAGLSGVHQFCRIGQHSMIGGLAKITHDVAPYVIVDGNPAAVRGINVVGLQRRGFTEEQRTTIKRAYRKIFLNKSGNIKAITEDLKGTELAAEPEAQNLIQFIEASQRGVTR